MAALGSQAAAAARGPAPYHPLVIVLTTAAAGIAADRWRPLPASIWWGGAIAGLIGWFLLWRRGHLAPAALALLLATAATAASWHHCRWQLFAANDLGFFAQPTQQPVCIEAIALQTPRPVPSSSGGAFRTIFRGDQVRLEVKLVAIRDGGVWRPASGRAQMAVAGPLDVEACDRLRVFSRLISTPPALNPGEFDRADNLRAEGIRSELRAGFRECVTRVEEGSSWSPWRLLERVRMHGRRMFEQLGGRYSALADAVLLGERETLDPEITQAYVETGTIHLLVVAGLHLGILAGTVLLVLRRLPIPRRAALVAAALFTLLYAALVDAQPPVVRATILMLFICGSFYFGRRRLGFNALAAAGLVVLAMNPCDLFRVGAQLSFLCVAGIMAFGRQWSLTSNAPNAIERPVPVERDNRPDRKGRRFGRGLRRRATAFGRRLLHGPDMQDPIERLLAKGRRWPGLRAVWLERVIRHLVLISFTIWGVTLPLVMARFHLLTPVAPVLNTLFVLPMWFAVLGGFMLLVLGTLVPPLAAPCAWACGLGLHVTEWLVHLGQRCHHFWVPGPPDWWLAGFYGGLALALALPRWRPPRRWCVAILAGWIAVGFSVSWLSRDRQHLRCTFLHVGHGEAIVIEMPNGRTLLYDVGQSGAPESATRATAGFLWSRGITHLDAVVLSHADSDHFNGLPGLLEKFSVGVVYVSPMMKDDPKPGVWALEEAIKQANVPIKLISAGDWLERRPEASSSEPTIEVLHPPAHGIFIHDNASCVTLLVEYRGQRILLTGDLEPPGLDDVLAEQPIHCDIMLVPHHGSRRSEPRALAAWSKPQFAVISASHRWDVRPVANVYKAAGSRVLHTADTGAVLTSLGPEGVEVKTFVAGAE